MNFAGAFLSIFKKSLDYSVHNLISETCMLCMDSQTMSHDSKKHGILKPFCSAACNIHNVIEKSLTLSQHFANNIE